MLCPTLSCRSLAIRSRSSAIPRAAEAWDAAPPAQFRTEILASGLAVVHGLDGRQFVAAVSGEGSTVLVDAEAVQDLSGYLPALAELLEGIRVS